MESLVNHTVKQRTAMRPMPHVGQICRTDPAFVRLLLHSGAGLQAGSYR
jgi:hypothetical protein